MAAKVEHAQPAIDGRHFRRLMRNAAEGPTRDWLGGLAGALVAATLKALPPADRIAMLDESGPNGIGIEIIASAEQRAALLTLAEAMPMKPAQQSERRAS